MIVISDSNILMSGLYNPNGTIVKILTSKSKIQFLAPQYLFEEIKEHWSSIEKFSVLNKVQLKNEFKTLKGKLKVVSIGEIPRKTLMEAYEVVKDIDENDTYFVAMHLFEKHKIWTGDIHLIKGLLKKGYDICVTTEELKKFLYKKD